MVGGYLSAYAGGAFQHHEVAVAQAEGGGEAGEAGAYNNYIGRHRAGL
jgi:hypothetical protein